MKIGVPKEIKNNECRVGLTPQSVKELTNDGHNVFVQANAGSNIGFQNSDYLAQGAEILSSAEEVYKKSELIVKVKEPIEEEFAFLREDLTLFTYLHLAANPKIANYQFTTLNPNLGVASYDDKEITLADIPGLIEGAHEGTGLGIQFLKHIERCKTLLHLIDITNHDLVAAYNQVKNELKNYSQDLLKKKELIVLNKVDLIDDALAKEIIKEFSKKIDREIITLSTLEKKSVSKIKSKLISYVT